MPASPPGPRRPDGRRTRWAEHRAARRAELVTAVLRAVTRHGADVGMDLIAAEAGTSKTVLYRYFEDKADLQDAVGRRVAEDVVAGIAAELAVDREPREQVAAVIDTYLRALEDRPEVYRYVVRRPVAPTAEDPLGHYSRRVAGELSRVIGDRLRAVRADSGAAQPWAHGIVGLVQAAGDWWLDSRPMTRASLRDYLTALIWDGFAGVFAADPATPARPLRLLPPGTGTDAG